jgi:hypothetical protein
MIRELGVGADHWKSHCSFNLIASSLQGVAAVMPTPTPRTRVLALPVLALPELPVPVPELLWAAFQRLLARTAPSMPARH